MSVGERIKEARKERGMTQAQLGEVIGLKQSTIAEIEAGKLKSWPDHAAKIARALGKPRTYFEPGLADSMELAPDLPEVDLFQDYVPVDVLPTYAGAGGGGTGDADRVVALLPRALVEDELKAKPSDLLVINVRGNSMEPLFFHGDQIVIDKRDTRPTQPGPFALLYADGYVVKNVEVLRAKGKLRIFSTNPIYTDDEEDPESVTIMGRPVWFARRL